MSALRYSCTQGMTGSRVIYATYRRSGLELGLDIWEIRVLLESGFAFRPMTVVWGKPLRAYFCAFFLIRPLTRNSPGSFVCAHLTAHEPNLAYRIADYNHIVSCLLFPPLPSSDSSSLTTIYSTSHLFFLGDLNFRLVLPATHSLSGITKRQQFLEALKKEEVREELKEFDQLLTERRKGTVFVGLRECEFWKFKCSYKYNLGDVDKYR